MKLSDTKLGPQRPYLRLVLPEPSLIPADTNTYPTPDQDAQAAREAATTPLALELKDDAVEIAIDRLKDGATLLEVLAGLHLAGFLAGHSIGSVTHKHQLRQARLEAATLGVLLDATKKAA